MNVNSQFHALAVFTLSAKISYSLDRSWMVLISVLLKAQEFTSDCADRTGHFADWGTSGSWDNLAAEV